MAAGLGQKLAAAEGWVEKISGPVLNCVDRWTYQDKEPDIIDQYLKKQKQLTTPQQKKMSTKGKKVRSLTVGASLFRIIWRENIENLFHFWLLDIDQHDID